MSLDNDNTAMSETFKPMTKIPPVLDLCLILPGLCPAGAGRAGTAGGGAGGVSHGKCTTPPRSAVSCYDAGLRWRGAPAALTLTGRPASVWGGGGLTSV